MCQRWLFPLTYSVGFKNQATASLPAANVVVTDQLNANLMDFSTLTLQSVVIGANVINIPAGRSTYSTLYPLSSSLSVRIQGSLNPDTGVLTFTFVSIDPTTGLPPSDPTAGFLPPDADGVSGQGSVIFDIQPKAGLATGTEIDNQGSIVFDANAPIATAIWSNTIDADAPVSTVTALPATETSNTFPVSWSGSDVGSGIQSYTIYVSDNGAPGTVWLAGVTTASATYTGQNGHSYGFFSVATDAVGNVQASKAVADTSTFVMGPPSSLSIRKSHNGDFAPGQNGARYITVSNASGAGATAGTVTVTETVPDGLTLQSMAGTGWSCAAGGHVRAQRSARRWGKLSEHHGHGQRGGRCGLSASESGERLGRRVAGWLVERIPLRTGSIALAMCFTRAR